MIQSSPHMCAHCLKLNGALASAKPHSNLSYQNKRGFFSFGGVSDDAFFVCRLCNTHWMRKCVRPGYVWSVVTAP